MKILGNSPIDSIISYTSLFNITCFVAIILGVLPYRVSLITLCCWSCVGWKNYI